MTITHKSLTEAQRAVQSCHAAINFVFEHPDRAGPWWKESNYLVQLEVDDKQKLEALLSQARSGNLKVSAFHEPDLDNQLTAIAIEPSELTQLLVKKIPLMFKNKQ